LQDSENATIFELAVILLTPNYAACMTNFLMLGHSSLILVVKI